MSPRQRPLWCGFATSTLRSCCPLTPSPASPHEPRRTGSARLMQIPRRSRAFCAAPAPRQRLPQAGCRVIPRPAVGGVLGTPWCRASGFASREARLLPVFNKLSTGSFRHIPQAAKRHAHLSRHSAQHDGGRRDSADRCGLRLSRRLRRPAPNRAPHWFAGSSFFARAVSFNLRPDSTPTESCQNSTTQRSPVGDLLSSLGCATQLDATTN